jgi:hypothetical protein
MKLRELKQKTLTRNNKGQAMGNNLLGAVAVVGVGAILMYLIILVSGNFRNTINVTELPTDFQTSITEVDGNVTDAFDLASIGLYVLAAAAILGVVFVIVRFVR